MSTTSTLKMKDQGKISELNPSTCSLCVSSHRYQSSYTEGQQSEYKPQGFVMPKLSINFSNVGQKSALPNAPPIRDTTDMGPRQAQYVTCTSPWDATTSSGLERTTSRRQRRHRAKLKKRDELEASMPEGLDFAARQKILFPKACKQREDADVRQARKAADKQQQNQAYQIFRHDLQQIIGHRIKFPKPMYPIFVRHYIPGQSFVMTDALLKDIDEVKHLHEASVDWTLFPNSPFHSELIQLQEQDDFSFDAPVGGQMGELTTPHTQSRSLFDNPNRKIDFDYSPQAGHLNSDDGAAFKGTLKKVPIKRSLPIVRKTATIPQAPKIVPKQALAKEATIPQLHLTRPPRVPVPTLTQQIAALKEKVVPPPYQHPYGASAFGGPKAVKRNGHQFNGRLGGFGSGL